MGYSSGSTVTDQLHMINFTGSIIPHAWNDTIRTEAGKPYALAQRILSDIVYWYRPVVDVDEQGNEVLRKKYKYDMIYFSYRQMEDTYGCARSSLQRALSHLEKIGVIKKHFRKINEKGYVQNNVLFIELIPSVLIGLTYPKTKSNDLDYEPMIAKDKKNVKENPENLKKENLPEEPNKTEIEEKTENSDDSEVWSKMNRPYGQKRPDPMVKNEQTLWSKMTTHTENTSENTSNIYNIYPSINNKSLTDAGSDGLETYTLQEIEEQLDFAKLYAYAEKNPEKVGKQDVDSLLYILYDLFNTRKPIKVAGEEKPSQVVISKISKLSWKHLCYAICQYKSQKTRIKHQTAYMVTVLYKALEQMHNDQLNQLSLETADGSESKPVQKKQPKNNFHNFPERDYTREQTKDLERILRGYAKE